MENIPSKVSLKMIYNYCIRFKLIPQYKNKYKMVARRQMWFQVDVQKIMYLNTFTCYFQCNLYLTAASSVI